MSPQAQSVAIPKRWPLVVPPENRDNTTAKDARLVNCYAEKELQSNDYWIYKRPGLSTDSNVSGPTGYGLGLGYWRQQPFGIFLPSSPGPAKLWALNTGSPPFASVYVGDLATSNLGTTWSFSKFLNNATGDDYLLMTNGTGKVWYLKYPYSIGTVPSVSANSLTRGIVQLDGTVYVMDNLGNILGSDLGDPTTWNPLNSVYAGAESDTGVAIAKQLSYIIALKSETTQFFYDADNPTGSPLLPVQGPMLNYGCVDGNSVQEIDGILLWITSNRTISPQVLRLDNLQMSIVSNPSIDRLLDNLTPPALGGSETVRSWVLKHGGHRFYGLTSVENNWTLVYDIDQNLWYQWTDKDGNFWPISSMGYVVTTTEGYHLAQHYSNGNVYYLDGDYMYPNDYGNIVPVDIYTQNWDAGIDRVKQLQTIRVNGDQTEGSLLYVRCSDDDYRSWTNFRRVDLSVKRPYLDNCGTFRRRAYHFRHYANTSMRVKSVDLQMDLGTL